MEIFDIMLKARLVNIATTVPKATLSVIAARQQSRADYLLRVLNAPIATQIAVRDAAAAVEAASGREAKGQGQLSRILTALLYPPFQPPAVAELATGAVFLPSSIITVRGTTSLFLPSGSFVFNSGKLIHYTGKTETQFTGCTGGTGVVQGGNIITQAGTPSAAEVGAYRDAFMAAFTRRSRNAIGALTFINEKHVWSWNFTP